MFDVNVVKKVKNKMNYIGSDVILFMLKENLSRYKKSKDDKDARKLLKMINEECYYLI